MKFVVAFIFVFFIGALADFDDDDKYDSKFKEYAVACANETNVDLLSFIDSLEKVEIGKIADNEKFDCFVTCLFQKSLILTSDGNLNEFLVQLLTLDSMSKGDFERILEKCKDISGATICQKGGKFLRCIVEDDFFQLIQ